MKSEDKTKIGILIQIDELAQEGIFDLISEMPRFSDECNCRGRTKTFKMIHEGQDDEVMEYCLECGGIK